MPSPFPGMNPYLEQPNSWREFHQDFISLARRALAAQVGPNYIVKIEVNLLVHELPADERRFIGTADAGVTHTSSPVAACATAVTSTAPMQLELPAVDLERHSSIEILDRSNRRVVTVLELLSPSNKRPNSDRDDYLAKRRKVLTSMTNLVEIGLRRGGMRPMPPELPSCDYYVLVARYEQRPRVDFWPLGLRSPLPIIPVPLLPADPDLSLDLQGILQEAYDYADYGKYIYNEKPEPALTPDDAAWARQFLPASASGGA